MRSYQMRAYHGRLMYRDFVHYWNWEFCQQLTLHLYKNWLTLKQWLRELYLKRVYSKLRTLPGYFNQILKRKTVKGLSQIKRNCKYGRK